MPAQLIKHALWGAMGLVMVVTAGSVHGQQFREQSDFNFPQPDPQEWTNQVSLADVNNNGSIDIAFANGGLYSTPGPAIPARLYINNGTGVFTDESTDCLGGIAGWFRGVEFADVNDNGSLDMVLASDFNQLPRLLMNDGNGFFTDETASRLPNITLSCTRIQFLDINNNGRLDMYLTNGGPTNRFGTGQNRIYINDGTGHFTDGTATYHPPVMGTAPMDAKIVDITGNFWLDIRVAGHFTNNSKLYLNDGTGMLTNASASVPSDSTCYAYDFADINNNGRMDMIGINGQPNWSTILIRNNGDGSFTNISNQLMPNPAVDDNDSKFFDFNNNGLLDLIVGRLGGTAERIYENNGNGTFTEVTGLITPISDSTLDIVVGDLNGNGKLDIVTGQGESGNFRNRIYFNNGPADTIPPTIVKTEQQDDTEDTDGPYVIRAAITDGMTSDRNFFDKGIFLNYSINDGDVQQVPMKWSGGQIYRGELPGQPGGSTVEYFVTATDFADNEGTGDTLSFEVIGSSTPGDLNNDGVVNVLDLLILLEQWGTCTDCPRSSCAADLNDDCAVNVLDLLILLENWG